MHKTMAIPTGWKQARELDAKDVRPTDPRLLKVSCFGFYEIVGIKNLGVFAFDGGKFVCGLTNLNLLTIEQMEEAVTYLKFKLRG